MHRDSLHQTSFISCAISHAAIECDCVGSSSNADVVNKPFVLHLLISLLLSLCPTSDFYFPIKCCRDLWVVCFLFFFFFFFGCFFSPCSVFYNNSALNTSNKTPYQYFLCPRKKAMLFEWSALAMPMWVWYSIFWAMIWFYTCLLNKIYFLLSFSCFPFSFSAKMMLCGATDACIVPIVVAGFSRCVRVSEAIQYYSGINVFKRGKRINWKCLRVNMWICVCGLRFHFLVYKWFPF